LSIYDNGIGMDADGLKTHYWTAGSSGKNNPEARAADGKYAKQCVEKFWNTPLRTGDRRYYDNFLYMFAMLALSGNYRIY
jgi:hypothetical protein